MKTLLKLGLLTGSMLAGISAAQAVPCLSAPVATYMVSGFSCSVDNGVTFSHINVTTSIAGSGSVGLGSFSPFNLGVESGLALSYTATTGLTGGQADVTWTYDVTGNGISDAFASITGGTTGTTGAVTLSEHLMGINGNTVGSILLTSANTSQAITFSPVNFLSAVKDQQDFASAGSSAFSSEMRNGFSVSVPGPLAGAGLPGLVTACGFLVALARRRRNKNAT